MGFDAATPTVTVAAVANLLDASLPATVTVTATQLPPGATPPAVVVAPGSPLVDGRSVCAGSYGAIHATFVVHCYGASADQALWLRDQLFTIRWLAGVEADPTGTQVVSTMGDPAAPWTLVTVPLIAWTPRSA